MAIATSILDCVGHTPLVQLRVLPDEAGCFAGIVAKLEYFNPAASVKDRLAKGLVAAAERDGALRPGQTPPQVIVEPTSGNTGIGLALVAAVKGYRLILTMPESMSEERKQLLRGVGAQLVLTPASEGMSGAIAEAERIVRETSGAVMLQQFRNAEGPVIHYHTTGQEIWDDCEGRVDAVVMGIGTGGTVTGVAKKLKELNSAIRIYGVEPAESAILSGGAAGPHLIQGIGAGFVPDILDRSLLDGIITVSGENAIATARALMHKEGLFCGISSGAAAYAALQLGKETGNEEKRIVFIAPDTSDRYLSTKLFTQEE